MARGGVGRVEGGVGRVEGGCRNKLFADKSFIPTRSAENKCASSPSNSRGTFLLFFPLFSRTDVEIEVAK